MGVRVSKSNLAAAVANEGCAGVIATVGLGHYENEPGADFAEGSRVALQKEIRKTRGMTDGIIGANVMVALSNYESLVRACVEEKVDMIISGAGLPMKLPAYTAGTDIQLIPIVSSARSLKLIYRKWTKDFNRSPDAVIVEGMKAGGHLGYSSEQLDPANANPGDRRRRHFHGAGHGPLSEVGRIGCTDGYAVCLHRRM
jgi:NAD(P)H-dependent flavin oxidoreductase YrpB (nitropropane dioxygenase family)